MFMLKVELHLLLELHFFFLYLAFEYMNTNSYLIAFVDDYEISCTFEPFEKVVIHYCTSHKTILNTHMEFEIN